LHAARSLGTDNGISKVTLTDIADAVGMHKSAMLRYYETREEIFLRLTADAWQEWSAALCHELHMLRQPQTGEVAATIARTLASRGFFCDLLAQTPLHLERNVSLGTLREYKLIALAEVDRLATAIRSVSPSLNEQDAADIIATATSLAGTFWHVATPGPEVAGLYRSDPRLAHAVVEIEPRVTRILIALLDGMTNAAARRN
ncbi:TetR family transcriptional regulator, partial [Mycobacterium terramassiliense]